MRPPGGRSKVGVGLRLTLVLAPIFSPSSLDVPPEANLCSAECPTRRSPAQQCRLCVYLLPSESSQRAHKVNRDSFLLESRRCREILITEQIVRLTPQGSRVATFASMTAPPFRFKDALAMTCWDSGRSVTYAVGTATVLAHRSCTVKSFPDRGAADRPASV